MHSSLDLDKISYTLISDNDGHSSHANIIIHACELSEMHLPVGTKETRNQCKCFFEKKAASEIPVVLRL